MAVRTILFAFLLMPAAAMAQDIQMQPPLTQPPEAEPVLEPYAIPDTDIDLTPEAPSPTDPGDAATLSPAVIEGAPGATLEIPIQ